MSHHAIRCSKCLYYLPSGSNWIPFDWTDCDACCGTGYVPERILAAIREAFPRKAEEIFTQLRWSGDHWSFTLAGMYVGVEIDGYIHT